VTADGVEADGLSSHQLDHCRVSGGGAHRNQVVVAPATGPGGGELSERLRHLFGCAHALSDEVEAAGELAIRGAIVRESREDLPPARRVAGRERACVVLPVAASDPANAVVGGDSVGDAIVAVDGGIPSE